MDVAWPVKNLSNKQLVLIPLVIAAIFGTVVALHWNSTGTPVPLGLDFQGGSFIRVENIQMPQKDQIDEFKIAFKEEYPGANFEARSVGDGMNIETSEVFLDNQKSASAKTWIQNQVSDMGLGSSPDINIDSMGSVITYVYRSRARNAAIATVVVMAIILFVALRKYPVVGSILLVIGLDFLGIIGGMALFGIELTRASMAGILLIFGYAVNTNILLSTNVLKRKGGTDQERAASAMSTGIKMSSTSAAAMVVLNLVTSAPELEQISAVLVIGILVDMANTWLLNSGLIMRHHGEKGEKYHARI